MQPVCSKCGRKWHYQETKVALPRDESGITKRRKWHYQETKVALPRDESGITKRHVGTSLFVNVSCENGHQVLDWV